MHAIMQRALGVIYFIRIYRSNVCYMIVIWCELPAEAVRPGSLGAILLGKIKSITRCEQYVDVCMYYDRITSHHQQGGVGSGVSDVCG